MTAKVIQAGGAVESSFGAPRQLVNFAPVRQWAVQFTDKDGAVAPVTIAVEIGGKFYLHPAGAAWAKDLQPAAEWLEKALTARVEAFERAASGAVSTVPEVPFEVQVPDASSE